MSGLGKLERAILEALRGSPAQYDGELARRAYDNPEISRSMLISTQRALRSLARLGLVHVDLVPTAVPVSKKLTRKGFRTVRLAHYSLPMVEKEKNNTYPAAAALQRSS